MSDLSTSPLPTGSTRPFGAPAVSSPAPEHDHYEEAEWPATSRPTVRSPHGPPPTSVVDRLGERSRAVQEDVPRSRSSRDQTPQAPPTEQAPPTGTAEEVPARQGSPTAHGLIGTIAQLQNGHTVQLTVTPAESGRVRLMVMAFERTASDDPPQRGAAKRAGRSVDRVPALPFQPIVALDFPSALDCPETGLIRAFTVLAEQERAIAEINRQTEAFEARKRAAEERLKKAQKDAGAATQKATAAEQKTTGGPSLFAGTADPAPTGTAPVPKADG